MEKPKYTSDPIVRGADVIGRGWEEGVTDKSTARSFFDGLKRGLEKHHIPLTSDTKILEVGSGSNIYLKFLQEQGLDAVGVDARPRGIKTDGVVAARIEQLPFPDETFGVVTALFVFDKGVYNQDQAIMLREIARVLKPSGVCYISQSFDKLEFEKYFEVLEEPESFGMGIYRKK